MKNTRDVVADDIPIALLRVQLHGEAANVTREIRWTFVPGDGWEPHKGRGFLAGPLEQIRCRDLIQGSIVLEVPVGAKTSRVNDAFRDALMIEVENLLTKVKILKRSRAAGSYAERILIVGHGRPLLSCQDGRVPTGRLVKFSACRTGQIFMWMLLFLFHIPLRMSQITCCRLRANVRGSRHPPF
jgi:hypothetical protein